MNLDLFSILLFKKKKFYAKVQTARRGLLKNSYSCAVTSLLAEGTYCEKTVQCSDVTEHTYGQIPRLTGNLATSDTSGIYTFCLLSVSVIFEEALTDLSGLGPSPCASVERGWEQVLAVGDVHYWPQRPAGPPPRAAGSAAE